MNDELPSLDPQKDQQRRLMLAIILTTLVMVAWMYLSPKQPVDLGPDGGTPGDAALALADAGSLADAAAPAGDGGLAAEAVPPPPEKTYELTSAAQKLTFSSRGGAISQAIIGNAGPWPDRKFFARENDPTGKPLAVSLAQVVAGQALPGAVAIRADVALPFDTAFESERTGNRVTFRTTGGPWGVEKIWEVNPGGYDLRLNVKVTNRTGAARQAALDLIYPARVDPATQKAGGMFAPPIESSQAFCRHATSNEIVGGLGGGGGACGMSCGGSPPAADVTQAFEGPVRFAGFDERYFMGMMWPRSNAGTRCTLHATPDGRREATIATDLGIVADGQMVEREFGFYLGPKAFQELKRVSEISAANSPVRAVGVVAPPAVGPPSADPDLPQAIDFGWWAVICQVLLWVMKFFQKAVVNWGVAIILLTVLVKAILYPLSYKQMQSMEEMRKIQPLLDALAKKYADDKEKMNVERMKLFQEHKVNPLGGCLPIAVQMPVWIALYQTLARSFELYREPLFGFWINDLTAHDPYYILPLAMGVTMFITQKMQPTMGDPTQAKIMLYFMPIFFTFLMLSLPAGLTLYIFTNNLLSIAQQKFLQRRFRLKAEAKERDKKR